VREYGGEEAIRQDYPGFAHDWEDAKRLHSYLDFDPKSTWKSIMGGVSDTVSAFGGAHMRFFSGVSKAVLGGKDITEPVRGMINNFKAAAEAKREEAAAAKAAGGQAAPQREEAPYREEEGDLLGLGGDNEFVTKPKDETEVFEKEIFPGDDDDSDVKAELISPLAQSKKAHATVGDE
jgi:hypothetical protein